MTMKMKKLFRFVLCRCSVAVAFGLMGLTAAAQTSEVPEETVSTGNNLTGGRLSVGGYGEVAYSRNFYSDNQYHYRNPNTYKNDPSNGRFDIPHAVIYINYDFGKGWKLGSEIEFEHTGTGSAIEIEDDEGGEYEHEIEKGGEVELEQFWLQKTFNPSLNLRLGHIVVPVGLNNAYHEPLNFFTVYRPEGENTILPSTWHDTGMSLWGIVGDFRYEAQLLAGLNALLFTRDGWINDGAGSAYEFKPANKYGVALRIDNYTVPGLRIGLSGYFGQTFHNTYPNEMEGDGKTYNKVKGNLWLGSIDFSYKRFNWIVRGQADYGYLSDTPLINSAKINSQKNSPYNKTYVGKNAVSIGIEAGYDVFSRLAYTRNRDQKLYVFGRYEYYDSYLQERTQPDFGYTKRQVVTTGINYFPLPQIVIKGNYSNRILKSQYNNEPSINIGIAYQGFFL